MILSMRTGGFTRGYEPPACRRLHIGCSAETVDSDDGPCRGERATRYNGTVDEALTCPQCTMPEPLEAVDGYECATCGHEWMAELGDQLDSIKDANGNLLTTGDDVTVVKELKLNGKSGGVKIGTKLRSIRLIEGDHEVSGKLEGRAIMIRAAFVKKA